MINHLRSLRCVVLLSALLPLLLIGCPNDLGLPDPPQPTEIRIATYNTHFFGPHNQSYPNGLKAESVIADIVHLTQEESLDIWILQEVYASLDPNPNSFETNHLELILAALPGWDGVYSPYTLGGTFAKGNALIWNTQKYEAVGAPLTVIWDTDGNKGALGLILRRLEDQREFLVVSAHFKAGLDFLSRKEEAIQAVAFYEAAIEQSANLISVPPADLPWVFGGDLNTGFGISEGCWKYLVEDKGMNPAADFFVKTFNVGFHLDHLLAKGLEVLGRDVSHDADQSDHYPFMASFALP